MRLVHIIALALSLGAGASAQDVSSIPHVAVVADADSGDLASIIAADLSSTPALALIEREDMAKIGNELKLQQLASENAVNLGRMLGADGLLFVQKQPTGFQVRLTAVGLGYAVFDDPIIAGASTDLPHLAQLIAERVVDYAPKLKLKPASAVPISVLDIRSDFSTPESVALERKLTLLLESQLSALPEYVVLERRHAGALLFERPLAPEATTPLQGAYVVDGAFTQPAEGAKELAVRLRVRSPDNRQNPLVVEGSTQDLAVIAAKMTSEIQKAVGKPLLPLSWQPAKEAREYLLEGIWAEQHGNTGAAIEALDSAEMLGEKAPDLLVTRIIALCQKAVGSSAVVHGFPQTPDDPKPEARIEAILRAFDDETRYESGGGSSRLKIIQPGQSMDVAINQIRDMLARSASSLLVMLDRAQSPNADDVRTRLCAFVGFDPLHGHLPSDFANAAQFVDDWANSADEEEAYYRIVITTPVKGWFITRQFLYPDHFCARFIPDPAKRRAAFLGFMQSMAEDPYGKPAGLLELAKYTDPASQEDALHDLGAYLTAERDQLFATGRLFQFLAGAFEIEKAHGDTVAGPQFIELLHFELQRSDNAGQLDQIWFPDLFSKDDAPRLWSELQLSRAKGAGTNSDLFYSHMSQRFVARWGNPNTTKSSAPTLMVNQFWCPKDADQHSHFRLGNYPLATLPDGVWVQGGTGLGENAIYHVGIDTSQADSFITAPPIAPDGISPQEMVATPDALYVLGEPAGHWRKSVVARYSLTLQRWDQHDVPYSTRIFQAAGKLYLSLGSPEPAAPEGGIALYDDQTGNTTVLASSRRRPAQNQFDDRDGYDVRNIFTGPGDKPCVEIGFGETYFISDAPGNWPRLIDSGRLEFKETDGMRTILYGPRSYRDKAQGMVVFFVDPAKLKPELWLGAPAPSFGTHMVGEPNAPLPAPWPKPPIFMDSPPWDNQASYGFRGNDLFCYVSDMATLTNELVWWHGGQSKPVHIPIIFKMSDADAAALKAATADEPPPDSRYQSPTTAGLELRISSKGLFFLVRDQGFYFLPYSDLDTYFKKLPTTRPK